MADLDKARATQIANIEAKTGKTLSTLTAQIKQSGLSKHGEVRAWLMEEHRLGHGDANLVAHTALAGGATTPTGTNHSLAEIYAGKKAHLRLIHERLMAEIEGFGEFEIAPKKGYVSLRRSKQFAMLGPKTNERFELGVNLKSAASHPLMKAQPPGGMCQYIATLSKVEDVDDALITIVRRAYDAAA